MRLANKKQEVLLKIFRECLFYFSLWLLRQTYIPFLTPSKHNAAFHVKWTGHMTLCKCENTCLHDTFAEYLYILIHLDKPSHENEKNLEAICEVFLVGIVFFLFRCLYYHFFITIFRFWGNSRGNGNIATHNYETKVKNLSQTLTLQNISAFIIWRHEEMDCQGNRLHGGLSYGKECRMWPCVTTHNEVHPCLTQLSKIPLLAQLHSSQHCILSFVPSNDMDNRFERFCSSFFCFQFDITLFRSEHLRQAARETRECAQLLPALWMYISRQQTDAPLLIYMKQKDCERFLSRGHYGCSRNCFLFCFVLSVALQSGWWNVGGVAGRGV